jgi:hypothetical protein
MFISLKEIESMVGRETAVSLCRWIGNYTPVTCRQEQGSADVQQFDIDEAIEYAKIKMHQDSFKRAFFPYLVKLKHYKICNGFEKDCSA